MSRNTGIHVLSGSLLFRIFLFVVVATGIASCAVSTSLEDGPSGNLHVITVTSIGDRLAWAHAHEKAAEDAQKYCAKIKMQSNIRSEFVRDGHAFQEQTAQITFECHPAF
jgi:hypothetical protein